MLHYRLLLLRSCALQRKQKFTRERKIQITQSVQAQQQAATLTETVLGAHACFEILSCCCRRVQCKSLIQIAAIFKSICCL
jgi:hypothetical protein